MKKLLMALCTAVFFSVSFVVVSANEIKVFDVGYSEVQKIIDNAQNGDTLIFAKGEYTYGQSFVIKNFCKLKVIAKGAKFVNRKTAVFKISNSNVIFQKGRFNECEVGIELSSSTISIDGARFKKNLVCILAENSVLKIKNNLFSIAYRAAIILVGNENVLNASKDNKFKNNYADICPGTEQGGTILTKALGTRINFE